MGRRGQSPGRSAGSSPQEARQPPSVLRAYDVGFVVFGFPSRRPSGGMETVFRLARELTDRGIKVVLIFMRHAFRYAYHAIGDSRLRPASRDEWVLWHVSPLMRGRRFQSTVWPAFRKMAGIDSPDLLLNGVDQAFSSHPSDLNFRCDHLVATWWVTAFYVRDAIPRVSGCGHYLIAHSEDTVEDNGRLAPLAGRTYGFPLKKIVYNSREFGRFELENPFMIRQGVRKNEFHLAVPLSSRKNATLLVPLRSDPAKGAAIGIEALELIHQRFPSLVVDAFGDYPRLAVPRWIRFHRDVSDSRLAQLYNRSSIFLLPSLIEGYSLPLVEAMLCGNAIVTTTGVPNPDFQEGLGGLVVPAGNAKALAAAIEKLVTNDALRIQMQRHNVSQIDSIASYREMAAGLWAALTRCEISPQ